MIRLFMWLDKGFKIFLLLNWCLKLENIFWFILMHYKRKKAMKSYIHLLLFKCQSWPHKLFILMIFICSSDMFNILCVTTKDPIFDFSSAQIMITYRSFPSHIKFLLVLQKTPTTSKIDQSRLSDISSISLIITNYGLSL